MKTIAGEVVAQLAQRGVRVVFGIPGVHTLELYRGLAAAGIRHVTARHEQGAGFMADGYARATGEPGVALVITGPGLTNTLTAMAQARADSVPMIVVSGVNARPSLGRGWGFCTNCPINAASRGWWRCVPSASRPPPTWCRWWQPPLRRARRPGPDPATSKFPSMSLLRPSHLPMRGSLTPQSLCRILAIALAAPSSNCAQRSAL